MLPYGFTDNKLSPPPLHRYPFISYPLITVNTRVVFFLLNFDKNKKQKKKKKVT